MYVAWQRQDDRTRFLHLFIFDSDGCSNGAQRVGRGGCASRPPYRPYLVDGDVTFTDYDLVASNQD